MLAMAWTIDRHLYLFFILVKVLANLARVLLSNRCEFFMSMASMNCKSPLSFSILHRFARHSAGYYGEILPLIGDP
jgi:hypothetical protein